MVGVLSIVWHITVDEKIAKIKQGTLISNKVNIGANGLGLYNEIKFMK